MSHFVRHDILRDTLIRGEAKGDDGAQPTPSSPFASPPFTSKIIIIVMSNEVRHLFLTQYCKN